MAGEGVARGANLMLQRDGNGEWLEKNRMVDMGGSKSLMANMDASPLTPVSHPYPSFAARGNQGYLGDLC